MRVSLLAAFLFFSLVSAAQKPDSILHILASRNPTEKLFIHYDKASYIAGETIWFKAYLSSEGRPSGLSADFWIELTDQKGSIVAAKKYPVLGATARGNIDLPDSLPQGNYYIRAATESMLNAAQEFIHRQNIFVFNPATAGNISAKSLPQTIQVQFFPESGWLVNGILTVVAFKATNAAGHPVDVNGVIRSEDGTTICSFKTYRDGMGKTQFKPQAGKKYKAEVEYPAGLTNHFALPEVLASGVNLKVQDEEGGKMFLLARSGRDKEQNRYVRIMAEMNNRVVYEMDIDFEDYPSVKGHLLTDSLPSGILHFTVFDKENMPLAERLTFVNNKEWRVEAALTPLNINAVKKAENSVEISFPEAIQRSLSVAITDGSDFRPPDQEDIRTSFLLTSDLKGEVHNPAWYFDTNSDSLAQALDNLMLTHGWSRYEWKKLLAGELPPAPAGAHQFLSVSGLVNDAQDKGPVQGGRLNIYLESSDSSSQNYEVMIGKDGRFRMDSLVFYGETKFYYVYTNEQGKERAVKLHVDESSGNTNDYPQFRDIKIMRQLYPNLVKDQYKQQYDALKDSKTKVKELERVTVQSKSPKKPVEIVNEKYTTGVFRAMGKTNIDNINQPPGDRSANAMDFIKNRIQQVELQGNRFVSRKNFSLMTGQKWAVDVYLDESPVNADQLRSIRVDEIALVKYYEAGFVGAASSSPGGLIAVYTKRKEKNQPPVDKLDFFIRNGYSVTRQFFQPDYSKPEQSHGADNRTTLYWNPDLYTDSDSKSVKLNFFNNDTGKKFRVTLEGFDVNGKLVHIEKWVQ